MRGAQKTLVLSNNSSKSASRLQSPWKSIFARFLSFLTPMESFPCSEMDLKIVLGISLTENRSKFNTKHWIKKMLTLRFFEKIKTFHILSSWHHDGGHGWFFGFPSRSQFTHGEFGVSHEGLLLQIRPGDHFKKNCNAFFGTPCTSKLEKTKWA